MNNELSAGLTQIVRMAQSVAVQYDCGKTDTLCALLGLLQTADASEAVSRLGVQTDNLLQQVKAELEKMPKAQFYSLVDLEHQPAMDADMQRIIKLCMLEKKLIGQDVPDALVMMLAMLHDRSNPAKGLLESHNVTYDALTYILKGKRETAGSYGFADDDNQQPPASDDDNPTSGAKAAGAGQPQGVRTAKNGSDTPITDKFGTDLTAIAAKGGLDPVVGREREIERMVQILARRKKNNPIITGEPGVGKSAIVEGLAARIAARKVPHLLLDKRIVALDMAAMVAGTQYRGQFEERLRRLIQELREHPEIILFMDEIHTIIGAGSAPGSLDAANMLKPALARGEVQCIGATTLGEYRKSIEKDGALERRFQKIMVEPTTEEETLVILANIKSRYEAHHHVTYTDEALEACVKLTSRYVSDRALPDKAIDALDEAGSRKQLGCTSTPPEITEKEESLDELKKQKLEAARNQDYERAARLRDEAKTLASEIERMTEEWKTTLDSNPAIVDAADVAEVVSLMSGIPATRLAASEEEKLRGLRDALQQRVIAQDDAVNHVVRAITRSRMGLKGTRRPIGTFLFVGPTGVGKTHLVQCLAEMMFGSRDALIRVDMSEYGEKHTVSRLVGSPPGYVGYDEGGQLTEKVRRHPYSVVLLDEIEKAHPDVFNTLLQVMDEGRMTDGNGTTVNFCHTLIVMTSNSGTRQLREMGNGIGFSSVGQELTSEAAASVIMKTLRKQFAPEFLNRIDDIVVFNPLSREGARSIASLELRDLCQRMADTGRTLTLTDSVTNLVAERGFDAQYGARSLKRYILHHIEDVLCDYLMEHDDAATLVADVVDGKVQVRRSEDSASTMAN